MKLAQVIEELVEEKGLDKNILAQIIFESILTIYKKNYPDLELKVNYNKKQDEIDILVEKKVVTSVSDEEKEISLRRARSINSDIELSQDILIPFEGKLNRVDIIKIKQIIAQKIRAIEAQAIYQEFKPKEGTIVQAVIHKCERNGITLKIQDTLAFLPKNFSIPGDKCIVGYAIRALLKEVLPQPQSENQLILDRTSSDFLKKLFEIEIPEVFEKLVEIKKIVRIAGYKSKVLVLSHDINIDPVGTCVGVGGVRIKPILKELVNEKIDIIPLSSSIEELIKDGLKPAIINRVELVDNKKAKVWLDEDQRSLAIGKLGQNIALASKLTSLEIELVKSDLELNKENKD